LRLSVPDAALMAIPLVASRATPSDGRIALMKALGETKTPAAVDNLLSLLSHDPAEPIKTAALAALGYFSDDHIADAILNQFSSLSPPLRARSLELLCSRPNWALKLT